MYQNEELKNTQIDFLAAIKDIMDTLRDISGKTDENRKFIAEFGDCQILKSAGHLMNKLEEVTEILIK